MLDNKERFHKAIQWLLENLKEQTSTAAVGAEAQAEAEAQTEIQESSEEFGDESSDSVIFFL
jgi:fatty acid-binding protein DegV